MSVTYGLLEEIHPDFLKEKIILYYKIYKEIYMYFSLGFKKISVNFSETARSREM
jgi:hypothetical protein